MNWKNKKDLFNLFGSKVAIEWWTILTSKKDKSGRRLQRSRFVIFHHGWPFTFTIERGDRLHDKGVD